MNETLRELYLNNTDLSSDAVPAIASAVGNGRSPLAILWLGGNDLDDGSAQLIARALPARHS